MRRGVFWSAALVVLAAAAPASAGLQDQDPAELMPPQTMAYLELHQAGQTARELANLLRDSPFEDLLASFARLQAKRPEAAGQFAQFLPAELSLLISPEAFGEAGRLRSGAVGFLGFNKKDEPELLGILLTGDSHLPAFALRLLLLETERVREVDRVGGVTLYQGYENSNEDEPVSPTGPIYAFTRGLVVVGTNKDQVRDALTRYQGKNAGPTLAGRDGFRSAVRLRTQPGLFAYVDGRATVEEIDRHRGQPLTDYEWKLIKRLVNPKSIRSLAANLTLYKSQAALQVQLQVDPSEKSPLLGLLASQAVTIEHLGAVPGGSAGALTVRLSTGDDLWERAIRLADGFAKETGTPDELRPGLAMRAWEKQNQLAVGKLLGGIDALTLAFHTPGMAKNDKQYLEHKPAFAREDAAEPTSDDAELKPLLIVQARTEEDAKELEAHLPALLTCLGADGKPSQQTVSGRRIYGLKVDAPGGSLWYGHQDRRLVLGLSLEAVAASLKCAQEGHGLAEHERVKQAFPRQPGTLLVGLLRLDTLLTPFVDEMFQPSEETSGAGETEEAKESELAKQVRQLKQLIAAQPPLVASLVRQGDVLTLEVRPIALQPLASRVIQTVFASAVEEKGVRDMPASTVPAAPPPAGAVNPMATPPAPAPAPAKPAPAGAPPAPPPNP